MTIHKGLFVRSFMGDNGIYPKPRGSSVWTSPDIISYGSNVCPDPVKTFLGNCFNSEFSDNIYGNIQNYVYVRGENKSSVSLDGKMYLYYSDSSMLLAPNTWKPIPSTKGKGYVQLKVGAGQKFVCNSNDDGIFALKPPRPEDHPCLISRISTKDHPAPIPKLDNITDFSIFLRSEQSIGYAQRNLRYVETTAPSFTLTEQLVNPFSDPITDAYIVLNLTAVPMGSLIQMTCPGSRQGCNLEISKRLVPDASYPNPVSLSVKITNMPKGFSFPLNVYFWRNGKQIDSRFKIDIDFVAAFAQNSAAYQYGVSLDQLVCADVYADGQVLDKAEYARELQEIGPRRIIRVGSCTHTVAPRK